MTETEPLQTEQAGKTSSLRTSLLVLLILLPFLILAMVYLVTSLHLVFARNDTTYPEGASVYAFLTALRTGRLYSSPFDFPFNVQMYGPVFYLTGLAFAKLAHGEPMMTTVLFRLLSFLSFLGSAGLVGYLSWKLEGSKRWAAASVVLSLACACSIPCSASARPDEFSVFLILIALAVYQAAEGRSRLAFWAGVLASLSFLTKQSTAPVFVALAIDSLIARRFRNAAALIAGSVPIPALICFALWLRHEPFLANFFAVRHAFGKWPLDFLVTFVRLNEIIAIPISIALLGAGLSWRKEKYRAILLTCALALLAALAALANAGAAANYLILPWMIAVLLVPAGLAQIEVWARRSAMIPSGLTLLGGFLLIHQWNLLPPIPSDLDATGLDKLKMLSDIPYLEMRSLEPQLLDPGYYHLLSLHDIWSIAPIVQQIDDEEYDLILIGGVDGPADSQFLVASWPGFSTRGTETLEPMMRHYRVLCEVPYHIALVPRDRSGTLKDKDITRIFGQPCRATGRVPQLAPGMR